MRTTRSSSHHGGEGFSTPTPRAGTPPRQIPLNFPLGCGPEDPPLVETCCKACWDSTPPVDRMTDTSKKHNLRKLRLRAVITELFNSAAHTEIEMYHGEIQISSIQVKRIKPLLLVRGGWQDQNFPGGGCDLLHLIFCQIFRIKIFVGETGGGPGEAALGGGVRPLNLQMTFSDT